MKKRQIIGLFVFLIVIAVAVFVSQTFSTISAIDPQDRIGYKKLDTNWEHEEFVTAEGTTYAGQTFIRDTLKTQELVDYEWIIEFESNFDLTWTNRTSIQDEVGVFSVTAIDSREQPPNIFRDYQSGCSISRGFNSITFNQSSFKYCYDEYNAFSDTETYLPLETNSYNQTRQHIITFKINEESYDGGKPPMDKYGFNYTIYKINFDGNEKTWSVTDGTLILKMIRENNAKINNLNVWVRSPEEFCGDSECNGVETYITCPDDCQAPEPEAEPEEFCGNNECNGQETYITCPEDCKTPILKKIQELSKTYWWILLVIAFLLYMIYRKSKQ